MAVWWSRRRSPCGRRGRISELGAELPRDRAGAAIGSLLELLGWIEADGDWTERGRWGAAFSELFGMIASYLPLLSRLPEIYNGELTLRSGTADGDREWHVHRELNLSVSSAAHSRYFADADEIVAEIFDREPVSEQPLFIADTGCGDGTWLARLHELVRERTLRGRHLDEHPLALVGIDASPTALEQAAVRLEELGTRVLLIHGDVTNPGAIAAALAEQGLASEDGLHVRAFLDHNRRYLGAPAASLDAPGVSSGAYLDDSGRALAGDEVERDLCAHLARWTPHVRKHGLVVVEAHSIAPGIAARHLGRLHSGAFDSYHAYSNQYPVEHQAFVACCRAAGLEALSYRGHRYPSHLPFVSVTLDRLVVAPAEGRLEPPAQQASAGLGAGGWQPEPGLDLEDGRALHRLLFADGDVRFPRVWAAGPTGWVVGEAIAAIDPRIEGARDGEAIRVMDYGAGTGTATIELLKALEERNVGPRLAERGAWIEVHLVDLPTGWFAQGHALLGGHPWVRFRSLSREGGGFRPLLEVMGGERVDVVLANMVFHLIPGSALSRAADELASVIRPGGLLAWSAPDLGPAGPCSVLLHDPNRAVRSRWLALLEDAATDSEVLRAAADTARAGLDPERMREAQQRADRRILPHPLAADVEAALERGFDGRIETRTHEMTSEEIVDALSVPSNQAEFLPELADPELRAAVIRELMRDVLSEMRAGPAGTSVGLNLHWVLGSHRRRAGGTGDR